MQLCILIYKNTGCGHPKALVSFIDVGQGDSIYVQDYLGHSMLIDTGPKDSRVISQIQKVTSCTKVHIDTLLLTHPDADHIGEASSLMDKGLVGSIIHNGFLDIDQPDETLMENILEKKDISKKKVLAGDVFDFANIHIDILYPFIEPYVEDIKSNSNSKKSSSKKSKKPTKIDDNLYSIVLKITSKDKSFLLTGDAPMSVEENLMERYGVSLQSNILKLGHHGSKFSSSQLFLDMVSPDEIVISAAKHNRYNHPNPETIQRVLEQQRKKPLRIRETFTGGNIVYNLE